VIRRFVGGVSVVIVLFVGVGSILDELCESLSFESFFARSWCCPAPEVLTET